MITINLSDWDAHRRAAHARECAAWYLRNRDKVNAKQRERNRRPEVKAQRDAYRAANKAHMLEWRKQYTKTAKYETWRDAHELRKRYGLTPEQRDAMLEAQAGACALCSCKLERRGRGPTSLCVDHCHRTGAVRALLCRLCNTGLGAFHDQPERLRAAADYLERNS